MITCRCGHCGSSFHVGVDYAGSRVTCKNCGYRVDVPGLSESSEPTAADSTPLEIPSYPEGTDWSEEASSLGDAHSTEGPPPSEETLRSEPVFERAPPHPTPPPLGPRPTDEMNVGLDPRAGVAKASLILGLLSPCCCGVPTALPAVICGHVALGHLGTGAVTRDKRYAVIGLALGYATIVFTVLGLLLGILMELGHLEEPAPPPSVRPRRPVKRPLPAERPLKVEETGVAEEAPPAPKTESDETGTLSPSELGEGKVYAVSKETPLMPELEPQGLERTDLRDVGVRGSSPRLRPLQSLRARLLICERGVSTAGRSESCPPRKATTSSPSRRSGWHRQTRREFPCASVCCGGVPSSPSICGMVSMSLEQRRRLASWNGRSPNLNGYPTTVTFFPLANTVIVRLSV